MGLLSKSKAMRQVTCADVVDSYGSTIERLSSSGRRLHSCRELPFEKALIEAALLELALLTNPPVPVKNLKGGYLMLAEFSDQDGETIDWSGEPPSAREELAKWFAVNGHKVKSQQTDLELVQAEAARRNVEWDLRLAALRDRHA